MFASLIENDQIAAYNRFLAWQHRFTQLQRTKLSLEIQADTDTLSIELAFKAKVVLPSYEKWRVTIAHYAIQKAFTADPCFAIKDIEALGYSYSTAASYLSTMAADGTLLKPRQGRYSAHLEVLIGGKDGG